jgi:CopG family nickel-responsive transcriptional regulator
MKRITITIEDDQLEKLDSHVEQHEYSSRSEAVRDLLRDAQTKELERASPETFCYATLSCVYDHETRELSKRLTEAQHERHDLSVATLHVHASHSECLEVTVLKGTLSEIRKLADEVLNQRGVRMGHLHIIPSQSGDHHKH